MLGLRFCAKAFPSCGERGPLFIAVRGPLTIAASLVAEHRLQTRRLSSCGSRAQLLRDMWDLPRPGLEPVSPALAGRFLTTAPQGKPINDFNISKDVRWWTLPEPDGGCLSTCQGVFFKWQETLKGGCDCPCWGDRGEGWNTCLVRCRGCCWSRGRKESALSVSLCVDRKKWERGLKEQRGIEPGLRA